MKMSSQLFKGLSLGMLLLANAAGGKLRTQLELFIDISEQDSVSGITRRSPGLVEAELVSGDSGRPSVHPLPLLPPAVADRLMAQAALEGVPVVQASAAGDSLAGGSSDSRPPVHASALPNHRYKYILTQSLMSTYVYGMAIPFAFEMGGDKIAGIQFLTFPSALVTHYMLSRRRPHDDARILGVTYFTANSIALSYMVPFMLFGSSEKKVPDGAGGYYVETKTYARVGHFAVLAAYPMGLYLGYKHGSRYEANPGRVGLQASMALSLGATGAALIPFLTDHIDDNSDDFRAGNAAFLLPAIGGHYLSYLYNRGGRISGGTGPGIFTHTLFGGLAGLAAIAWLDISTPNEDLNSLIAASALGGGFAEGWFFFRNRRDSFEQAGYNFLGAIGGMLLPLGVGIILETKATERSTTTSLTLGALAGYSLTRWVTGSLVENSTHSAGEKPMFSLNPIPYPEVYSVCGRSAIRYRADILQWRFN